MDASFELEAINDEDDAAALHEFTREEEVELVHQRKFSLNASGLDDAALSSIHEELADYSKLFLSQQLAQQEVDIYSDKLDLYQHGFCWVSDMLGPLRRSK
jgi:hypothetical protein